MGHTCSEKTRKRSRSPRDGARKKRSRSKPSVAHEQHGHIKDSDRPHFRWTRSMSLGPEGRYKVRGHLGDGTFGRVLSAKDRRTGGQVAVKVIKSAEHLRELAEEEAEVLWRIQRSDPPKLMQELQSGPDRSALIVRLLDSFLEPDGHFCMVFEQLGTSLRDFLKRNSARGLYLSDVQVISRQLLQALATLHLLGFIHTDLKCRNVMLRHSSHFSAPSPREPGLATMRPTDCSISLIDFGGCVHQSDDCSRGRAGTRQFRGPELVLGLDWDSPVDMWAAGCVIYMLYFGKRPFSVHESAEHLAMMERLTESCFPPWMLQTAQECQDDEASYELLITEDKKLVWPEGPAGARVEALRPLSAQVLPRHKTFLSFLKGLFQQLGAESF
ncbi:unnamed protein product [Durusdinium trenchii]|uniref:Protein kinase domain-containing protein n=1 Tax=Durusdinium trenchii TaxID=1381693 RepID=A0ABP0PV29_9DINO